MNAQTMAKSPGYQQAWLSKARNPSTFAWIVAIFAVLVQAQGVLKFLDPCRVATCAPSVRNIFSALCRKFSFYSDRI